MTALVITDLTQGTLDGTGAFDVLIRANMAHLAVEFKHNRIKGVEYAAVFTSALETSMRVGLEFLLQRQRISLESQLMEQQIIVAQVEVLKANAALAMTRQQTINLEVEHSILLLNADKVNADADQVVAQTALIAQQRANALSENAVIVANAAKIPVEVSQVQAQTLLIGQQKINLAAEGANIPKQGVMLDAQASLALKQVSIADAEIGIKQQQVLTATAEVGIAQAKLANVPKEGLHLVAQTSLVTQQTANTTLEAVNIPKQGLLLDEGLCKAKAEFDLLVVSKTKSLSEIELLTLKSSTEKAQTLSLGVDADSVLGKQKALYQAQTDGFKRDAEQKAAKLMADTWSLRRSTDASTAPVDEINKLNDQHVGGAIAKMLAGVGA